MRKGCIPNVFMCCLQVLDDGRLTVMVDEGSSPWSIFRNTLTHHDCRHARFRNSVSSTSSGIARRSRGLRVATGDGTVRATCPPGLLLQRTRLRDHPVPRSIQNRPGAEERDGARIGEILVQYRLRESCWRTRNITLTARCRGRREYWLASGCWDPRRMARGRIF